MMSVRRFADRGLRKTSRTCQPPRFTSNGSNTRKSHKKEACCFLVQTDVWSSSIFLKAHAAKCPRVETPSNMIRKKRTPFSKKATVKTCGTWLVVSTTVITKYSEQSCTSQMTQPLPLHWTTSMAWGKWEQASITLPIPRWTIFVMTRERSLALRGMDWNDSFPHHKEKKFPEGHTWELLPAWDFKKVEEQQKSSRRHTAGPFATLKHSELAEHLQNTKAG